MDIGCGYGANKYATTVSDILDLSNHYKDKSFVKINEKKLPFKDKEFDFVIASHVVEHVEDVSFFLKEAPPLLFNPHGKSVKVTAYLYPEEGDALSLLWFSELQELEKDEKGNLQPVEEEALMKTMISPFCKEVYYCYYGEEDDEEDDIKTWEISSDLLESEKKDGFRIPDFMKLVFSWDDEDLERTISLPIKRLSSSGIEPEPQ